jgi:NAD(P)H-dependent flavin oxidoreductase YrpB (nitropropane dioxygenase family)
LAAATELDTLPILGTLRNTVRAWKNTAALKVAELESKQAESGEILSVVAGTATKRMYEGGDLDAGVIPCSQGIGLVHEIKPVAEVIDGMMQEASETLERLPR